MKKTNEKKVLVLSFLGVITLIAVVVGATYAYFTAQGGGTGNINVNANTATTDNLSFQVGEAISLTANQEDFGSGMSNKSGSTYARAILTANNATNNATRNYYVYLNITSNDFEYTTVDEQGEILLKVTDHDGSEVTSLSGLTRKTSGSGDNQVTGFDITESQGLITIANNYEITSTGTETQEWQVEVIFVNLDSDQNANTGKSFSANLIIQEEPMQTRVNLASYITDTLYTEDGVNGLYYHDGSGSYINADQEAGDYSYRFSGGDYRVTEVATEAGLTKVYTTSRNDINGVINFYYNGEKSYVGTGITNPQEYYYTLAYDEEIHYDTLESVLTQAVSDGYLTRDNIRNFVCFGPGAGESSCSEDNLYRIIGVFDGKVKLIKYDYADTTMLGIDGDYIRVQTDSFWSGMRRDANTVLRYYWNGSNGEESTNDWNASRLNAINLNTNYWNYLGSEWQNKILNIDWQVGGNTRDSIKAQSVKTVYTNEIVNSAEKITYQDEIGLIYMSDYMYAVDPIDWLTTENLYNTVIGDNWMYMGWSDWIITRCSNTTVTVLLVSQAGNGTTGTVNNGTSGYGVRPVFYLNSDVEIYEGHVGTQSDPYRIVI